MFSDSCSVGTTARNDSVISFRLLRQHCQGEASSCFMLSSIFIHRVTTRPCGKITWHLYHLESFVFRAKLSLCTTPQHSELSASPPLFNTLDQGLTNLRSRPKIGSRGFFDGSRCKSKNKNWGRCKISPTPRTRLSGRVKYVRGLTSYFIQGHLRQIVGTVTKDERFLNKFLYYC